MKFNTTMMKFKFVAEIELGKKIRFSLLEPVGGNPSLYAWERAKKIVALKGYKNLAFSE